jgi:hypothetical protein
MAANPHIGGESQGEAQGRQGEAQGTVNLCFRQPVLPGDRQLVSRVPRLQGPGTDNSGGDADGGLIGDRQVGVAGDRQVGVAGDGVAGDRQVGGMAGKLGAWGLGFGQWSRMSSRAIGVANS